MGAVNVGIGHDDDLVIPQFGLIKFVADSAAKGGNHVFNFVRIENSVQSCFLYIEDLTSKRQDGLSHSVSSLFCTSAGGVTLD